MFSYHSTIKPNKAFCYRPITQNQAIPMHESCQTCLNRWEPGLPSNAISRFQGWEIVGGKEKHFFFWRNLCDVNPTRKSLSPNASPFWSFNKTKQNAFSKNICSCQLSRQMLWNLLVETSAISLTHWRGMKKRSEIISIWGLCRCNFCILLLF